MLSFMKGAMLLLLLAAVSTSADSDHCDGLNKTIPPNDLLKVHGNWALVWAVSDHQEGWNLLANLSSSHVEIKHLPEENFISLIERNMFIDKTWDKYTLNLTMPVPPENFTLHSSTAFLEKEGVSNLLNETGAVQFFETCENCMVQYFRDDVGTFLMIYKREGHHTDAEKMKEDHESHKKLAVCMGFPLEVIFTYDGVTDFCHKKSAPEVAAPEVAAPEVAAPEVAAPEVAAPEVAAPEPSS